MGVLDDNTPMSTEYYTDNVARGRLDVQVLNTVYPYLSVVDSAAPSVRRPIPFATQASTHNITVTAAVSGTSGGTVNFQTGRFTVAPIVQLASSNPLYMPYVSSQTGGTSMIVGIRHIDNVSATATVTVHVVAIQMTPTLAAG